MKEYDRVCAIGVTYILTFLYIYITCSIPRVVEPHYYGHSQDCVKVIPMEKWA